MNWPAFANPWMLAGLAAVGLPVLIHFLTRARPRRIDFPPFQFLLEACAGRQSMHRLRTIVLLAIRCLAVLALALLFARPFLKPSGAPAGSDAAKRVVLILDASLSMRAVQQGVPLFARAQAEAADILRGLESGSEAAVILEGATPRALLPALSRNIPALHDELVKTGATYESGDPGAALALAVKLLGGAGTIYIFSDFQKANWQGVGELPGGMICRLRPVTRETVDNVAITGARLSPSEPVIGEPLEIAGTVFNCTPRPRDETVRLELGEFSRQAHVKVPPFGTANAAFNVSLSRPGAYVAKLALEPDDLAEDNTRWLQVRVSQALRILLISDAEVSDPQSAAYYVSHALVPSAQAAPGLTLIRRTSQDADRGVLETADVFVLVAPAMPSQEAGEIIARRVREGARLMVFLDGPTASNLASPVFDPPFHLQRAVTSDAGDPLVVAPKSKLFAGDATDELAALRFHRHFQVQLVDNRRDEVMASYPDGAPALTLGSMGTGMSVFANLPLTPRDGDFVGSPMFPALMHELLGELRRGSDEQSVTPGSAWVLNLATPGEGVPTVSDPQGRAFPAQVLASGRMTRLAISAPRLPGVYPVKQGETVVAYGIVNVDARESDTRPIPLETLKSGKDASVSVASNEEDLMLARNRPLWPLLAAAAAAMLALEMLLLALWRGPVIPARRAIAGKVGAPEHKLEAVR